MRVLLQPNHRIRLTLLPLPRADDLTFTPTPDPEKSARRGAAAPAEVSPASNAAPQARNFWGVFQSNLCGFEIEADTEF